MSIKNTIAEMLNIETYEAECEKLRGMVESLSNQAASYKVASERMAKELEFYKLKDEDKLKVMREDIKGLADQYIKNIQIYQEAAANCASMIDNMNDKTKRAYNHGFSEGRMAAYSEMGIWRLDAKEAGNCLVMDQEGNVFELLQLEDVKADEPVSHNEAWDEIIIDDLTEIGA